MSTLQVTTITTVNNTTPLILATGNTGGGQIVLNSANADIQMLGNFKFSNTTFAGDLSFTGNVAVGANITDFSSTGKNAKFAIDSGGLNLDDGYFMAWGGGTGRTSITGNKNNGTLVLASAANNSGYMTFATNTAERMRIDSSGNIGIGTTSPSYKLHVYTPSSYGSASSALFQGNSPNASGLYIQNDNSSAYGTIYSYGNTGYGVTNWANSFVIEAVPSTGGNLVLDAYTGSVVFQTGRSNRMVINSSGNVGIGTTSPGYKLHVEGETFLGRTDSSTEGGQLSFARSSDNSLLYAIDVNGSGSSPEFRLLNQAGGTVFFSAAPAGVNYIKFNPTQMAIGDANCLDDYEEGTWTPTYAGTTSGTGTHTQQTGYYVKVGRLVTVWFIIRGTRGTTSGNLVITGLPFPVFNSGMDYGYMVKTGGYWGGWVTVPNTMYATNGQSYIALWDVNTNAINSSTLDASVQNNMMGQLCYLSTS